MTESVRYRCLNCGNRFIVEVLTEEEREEARRKNTPTSPITCPECHRTDVDRGWL